MAFILGMVTYVLLGLWMFSLAFGPYPWLP